MSKIIAEIGVNWNGDISIAKDMILQSKRAGADAVKFQMFNEKIIKDSKYKNELSEMILDFSTLNELRGYAFKNYISFGVSAMYPELFDYIYNLGVPVDFIKIRCKDNTSKEIAEPAVKYCNRFDIPLLVSTERLKYTLYYTSHANYLYCVPKYPPELNEIQNKYINGFYFSGYSNHFPSPYLPMIAVARELRYVEIHVKRPAASEQIDEPVSIDFDDLKRVCDFRDTLSELRGN